MSDLLIRSASLTPQTANPENRTVEVVWSTGAGVRRRDMNGEYIERLSLESSSVDLSRLLGASVLDAHRQGAVRDVLGAVRTAQVDGKQGTALLQFSARAEVEPIWQDVLSGIVRHVSVGYPTMTPGGTIPPAQLAFPLINSDWKKFYRDIAIR